MYDASRIRLPVGATDEERAFSLKDLFRALWRRIWVVLLAPVLVCGAIVWYDLGQRPVYEASTQMLVGKDQGRDAPVILASDVQGLQQLAQTVVEAIESRRMAEAVIGELGLQVTPKQFLENLKVRRVTETQFIQVGYRDPNPEQARRIVDAVGSVSSQQISSMDSGANISAAVWERAETPRTPASPNPLRDGLLALVVGLVLGVGLALLLDYLDDSWRSPEEVEQFSGVSTLCTIPKFEARRARPKAARDLAGGR